MKTDEMPTHTGLCYCKDCGSVRFGVKMIPKKVLQEREVAEPGDGGFYALCMTCSPHMGFMLETLLNGRLGAFTIHYPLTVGRAHRGGLLVVRDLRQDASRATKTHEKDPEAPEEK